MVKTGIDDLPGEAGVTAAWDSLRDIPSTDPEMPARCAMVHTVTVTSTLTMALRVCAAEGNGQCSAWPAHLGAGL